MQHVYLPEETAKKVPFFSLLPNAQMLRKRKHLESSVCFDIGLNQDKLAFSFNHLILVSADPAWLKAKPVWVSIRAARVPHFLCLLRHSLLDPVKNLLQYNLLCPVKVKIPHDIKALKPDASCPGCTTSVIFFSFPNNRSRFPAKDP